MIRNIEHVNLSTDRQAIDGGQVRDVRLTYIVAIKFSDGVVIAGDTRVSGLTADHNYVCKIGILFPGCVYGISGNANEAATMLSSIKEAIPTGRDVSYKWDLFQMIALGYIEQSNDHEKSFSLLLSTTAHGNPQVWIFDSMKGFTQSDPNLPFVSIGHSKARVILDEHVESVKGAVKVDH